MDILSLLMMILIIAFLLFILTWIVVFYLYNIIRDNIFLILYIVLLLGFLALFLIFRQFIKTKLLIFIIICSGLFYLTYYFLYKEPHIYIDNNTPSSSKEFLNIVILIYLYLIIILYGIYAMSSND